MLSRFTVEQRRTGGAIPLNSYSYRAVSGKIEGKRRGRRAIRDQKGLRGLSVTHWRVWKLINDKTVERA